MDSPRVSQGRSWPPARMSTLVTWLAFTSSGWWGSALETIQRAVVRRGAVTRADGRMGVVLLATELVSIWFGYRLVISSWPRRIKRARFVPTTTPLYDLKVKRVAEPLPTASSWIEIDARCQLGLYMAQDELWYQGTWELPRYPFSEPRNIYSLPFCRRPVCHLAPPGPVGPAMT